MKKEELKKCALELSIASYLDLKEAAAQIEKRMDKLKESITAEANHRMAEFEDGELVLKTGKLKVALNPHKMVFEASGKTVTPLQRAQISLLVPEAYRTVDLNVKLINDRMNADKLLKNSLKSQGVVVVQDTRFDIKPNK